MPEREEGPPGAPEINADTELWRRIRPSPPQMVEGGSRPSSAAFRDGLTGELSVHIAELTTVESVLSRYPDFKIAAFSAGVPLELEYEVLSDPTDEDPSHAIVRPKMTKSHARRVAKCCWWVR